MENTNASVSSIMDESHLNTAINLNTTLLNNRDSDPVKQMFTAITKALRTQSIGIRDLSHKAKENLSKTAFENALKDISTKYIRNEQLSGINSKLNEKCDQSFVINEIEKV